MVTLPPDCIIEVGHHVDGTADVYTWFTALGLAIRVTPLCDRIARAQHKRRYEETMRRIWLTALTLRRRKVAAIQARVGRQRLGNEIQDTRGVKGVI
jgi:hypothetical protein